MSLVDELRAEQEALDRIVAPLAPEQWALATPSPGWTVADQIGHLTYFDGTAATSIVDPEAFALTVKELRTSGRSKEEITLHRHFTPAELLAAWRDNRARLLERASTLDDNSRVDWYGPPMSGRSFLTARLMEVWAHGQDIADTLGIERPVTDRLRHIAHLGIITRRWTYANRRLDVPVEEVRVELRAPSGELWRFGPDHAEAGVQGSALDFCLVVTQRRHVDDTSLAVHGRAARDWLEKAQAFAGPPTDPPQRRNRREQQPPSQRSAAHG